MDSGCEMEPGIPGELMGSAAEGVVLLQDEHALVAKFRKHASGRETANARTDHHNVDRFCIHGWRLQTELAARERKKDRFRQQLLRDRRPPGVEAEALAKG